MRRIDLTAEQRDALDLGRNTVSLAGAGSGKTRVLVARYVDALADARCDVSRVVAVTFTTKAAAEMVERVRREVKARAAAGGAGAAAWDGLLDALPAARIGTIHAFCSRLLRENAVEAGVDPFFGIIAEDEARDLLGRTVGDVLDGIAEDRDDPEGPGLLDLLDAGSRSRIIDGFRALLARRGRTERWLAEVEGLDAEGHLLRYRSARALVESAARAARKRRLSALAALPSFRRRARGWVETLAGIVLAEGRSVTADESRAIMSDGLEALLAAPDPEGGLLLETLLDRVADFGKIDTKPTKRWPAAAKESLREVADALGGFDVPLPDFGSVTEEADREHARLEVAVARIAARALRVHGEARAEEGVLDFDDLVLRARALLRNAAARERIAAGISHLLVDEFQDTDRDQWGIFAAILGDSKALSRTGLLVAGDGKQAIYRFRGAEVEVFQGAAEAILASAPPSKNAHLRGNFRSRRGLVEFVNRLSEFLFVPAVEPWEARHEPMTACRSAPESGTIEILRVGSDEGAAARARAAAAAVARRIRALLDDAPPVEDLVTKQLRPLRAGDIAVLFRRRTHLSRYEAALREAAIPFRSAGGRGFYDRPEVIDIGNLAEWLSEPDHDLLLAGLLRSPFFALPDADLVLLSLREGRSLREKLDRAAAEEPESVAGSAGRILGRLLELRGRIPVAELLGIAIRETGYAAVLAAGPRPDFDRANLRKLIDRIRNLERERFLTLADVARRLRAHVENEREDDGEADTAGVAQDAVVLQTVHGAKGLEYPVVILAEAHASLPAGERSAIVMEDVSEDLAILAVSLRDDDGKDVAETTSRAMVRWAAARRDLAEEKRLLYVAVTRARDLLIVAGAGAAARLSWQAWIAGLLGDLEAPGPREVEGVTAAIEVRSEPVLGAAEPVARRMTVAEALAGEAAAAADAAGGGGGAEGAGDGDVPAEAEGPPRTAIPITGSALKRLAACAIKYHLDRVVGIQESTLNGDPGARRMRFALGRGRVMHRVVEGMIHGADPVAMARVAALEAGLVEPRHVEDLCREAAALAPRLSASEIWGRIERATPGSVRAEYPFTMMHGGARFGGTLDLAFHDPAADAWVVVDWKSDRGLEGRRDPDRVIADRGYDLQLRLYTLALRRFTGSDRAEGWICFLESGEARPVARCPSRAMESFESGLLAFAERASRWPPPPPDSEGVCSDCGFRSSGLCPAWRDGRFNGP